MAGDTIEQVVVKFIADNASYLRDIKKMQDALHQYSVYSSNVLEKIEKNTAMMAKGYNNVTKAIAEQARETQKTLQVQAKAQAYTATLNNTTLNGYQKLVAVQALLGKQTQQTASITNNFHKQATSSTMAMFQHYTNLGAQLGFLVRQYVSLYAAVRTIQSVVKEGLDFNKFKEETIVAFTVMMRSADAAKAKMEELYNFAVRSPLTFKETAEGARQLIAYGFRADELVGTMEMLGTVGKAVGASMADMAYTYGTLRSQGRAYSRDLLQFAMRGIPIYEELAKVMEVPVNKIQKLASEGEIGFKQVEQAFINMTDKAGRFGGILDAWMSTFSGKLSMLTDILQKNLGQMMGPLLNIMKSVVVDLTAMMETSDFANLMEQMGRGIGIFVSQLVNFLQVLISSKDVLSLLWKTIKLVVSIKISTSILSLLASLPTKIMGLASLFTVLSSGAVTASGSVVTLASAFKTLNAAIVFNPFSAWVVALTAIVSLIPVVVAKMSALQAQTKEAVQNDPIFRKSFFLSQFKAITSPTMGADQFKAEDFMVGGKDVGTYYIPIIKDLAKKYSVDAKSVAKDLLEANGITANLYNKMIDYLNREAMQLGKTVKAVEKKVGDVAYPQIATLMQELSGLPISQIAKPKEAQKGVTVGTGQPYDVITQWDILTEEATKQYLSTLKGSILKILEADSEFARKTGETVDYANEQKKALEKEKRELIETYQKVMETEVGAAGGLGYAVDDLIIARLREINITLNGLDAEKKAQDELTKALEKYKDEMLKMQDQIDLNAALGFDPTELQKLTYNYEKALKDIDAGRGIFEFITDPEKRNAYKALLGDIFKFDTAKLANTQAIAKKTAEVNFNLEYQQTLLQGQSLFYDRELEIFDLELETKKKLLQITIDQNNEQSEAARRELEWVEKIGKAQRDNLQQELALSKAKKFLMGEGEEKYWNKVYLRLATSMGMKLPAYEKGTPLVPETGPAILHKGEMVIPAEGANLLREYFLRSGGIRDTALAMKGPQYSLDEAIAKSVQIGISQGLFSSEADFWSSRNEGLLKNTWYSKGVFPKDMEWNEFAYSNKWADYFIDMNKNLFDPNSGDLGYQQSRLIALRDTASGFSPKDVFMHETGHAMSRYILGNRLYNAIGLNDYQAIFTRQEAIKEQIKALEDSATIDKSWDVLMQITGRIGELLQENEKLTAQYKSHPLEQMASWLGGLFGPVQNLYGLEGELERVYADVSKWTGLDISKYASGTSGASRGWAVVGEKGPELMYMRGGETVVPNHALKGYAEGTTDIVRLLKDMFMVYMGAEKTQVGELTSGDGGMGQVLRQLMGSFGSLFGQIAEVNQILNPFMTIMQGMMDVLGPAISTALKPLIDILSAIGGFLGEMLLPIIRAVGKAFKWLANLLGINSEKLAEQLEAGSTSLGDTISYLNSKLQEEIDKQIGSYQQLYELGLMTASEYEQQVARVNAMGPKQNEMVSASDQALKDISEITSRLNELTALQYAIETGDFTKKEQAKLYEGFGLVTSGPEKANIGAKIDIIINGTVVTERELVASVEEGVRRGTRRGYVDV